VIQSHIDTNLTIEELMALVGFGVQTQRSNVQMLMLPGQFSEPGQYKASYWLPDSDRIATMMEHFNVSSLIQNKPLTGNPAWRFKIALVAIALSKH